MANINKNLGLMEDPDEGWKKLKAKATVKTVLKNRNLEQESQEFFQANLDMTKDFLPKQTMAQKGTTVDSDRIRLDLYDQQWHRTDDTATAKTNNKMLPTPLDAYNVVYPHGNPVPFSAATKPTTSTADDHKGGYRGDDEVPQGRIGSIQLEIKEGSGTQIGDHYLPDNAWNGPDKVKMPATQISSSSDAKNKCNTSDSQVSVNLGSLIEQALIKTHKNMNSIDMSGAIASTKEKKVLNKPFKTPNGKAAFAVYVKNDQNSIVRVDFDACEASDPTNIGPTWTSQHWGSKVNVAKASTGKMATLDQLSDFYYEKPVNPKNNEDWDGYTFYSQSDILANYPTLKNMPSVYTLNIATKKGEGTPSDTQYNSSVKSQLDSVAAK